MDHPQHSGSSVRALPILAVLALLTSLALAPIFFVSEAQKKVGGQGLLKRTESHGEGLENYDIRSDKAAFNKLANLRERHNASASAVADARDRAVQAEDDLRSRVSNLKVSYGSETRMPEVISPGEMLKAEKLSGSVGSSRADTLKQFVSANQDLFGVDGQQIDSLKVAADYTNPDGGMSFVRLEQEVNGIPVFNGEVRGGFSKKGDLVRVINSLAADVQSSVSAEFGDPSNAFSIAAASIGRNVASSDLTKPSVSATEDRAVFGEGDFAPTAEKMYFPTEPGVLVPAWRVLLWEPVNAYYVIVDADSQAVLWRKNLTEDQTQSATYNVYTNPNAMINIADSPAPLTPGPIDPGLGTQGVLTGRSSVSLIGNEGVYSFNNLGWLTDGSNVLDGNAVQAGPDRNCLVDAATGLCQTTSGVAIPGNGVDANISGSGSRDFTFAYNPAPGNPAPGDEPLPAGAIPDVCTATPAATSDFQKGAITQLFYIANRYHDELYRLGFNEQSFNFQNNNFGRGGTGNDRVSAEAQDCSGVNNANFSTPADGGRGRMQMYVWSGPTPDRDGSLDVDIVIHELTHGTSNRLHGNSNGLGTNMARGMGEGWSDFYAHALLSEPTDPINGIYTTGGYATHQIVTNFTGSYYYGIRRFPKAVLAFTGGPNNRPHNPLTFADADSTKINLNDGAFARGPVGSSSADAVHNLGEIWSSMLWEIRARYIQRLGWEVGNRRILQHVTDAMKLSPVNPTFLTSRDAVVAAALAGGSAEDVSDVWAGFALRGLGASATISNPGTSGGNATRVTEAFDLPNLTQPGITVSDVTGDSDGNFEPGETVRLTVPLENRTGSTATSVEVQLGSGQQLAYGSIANNGSASNQFNFTIPAGLPCGGVVDVTINVTSSLGPVSFTRRISTGAPIVTATENFDAVTAPAFPAGWDIVNEVNGAANAFRTTTTTPNSAPNAAFAPNPAGVASGQNGSTSITSPTYPIQSGSATVSFRHRYNTEASWDGGVLEISIDGGAYQDIVVAGGSFKQNGYNGFLSDNDNPIDLRNAWTGNSSGYLTTIAQLPSSAAGKNVRLRWRFGMDGNTGVEGWFVDDVSVSGQSQCSFAATSNKRSDFDGDGKSDFTVFRPSDGNWYIWTAASQFIGLNWGANGDIPAPADYDKDGKTDAAVYRPGQNGNPSYFYALNSSDLTLTGVQWGGAGDVPVVRDYDGDDRADFAIYRPSTGSWYVYEADGNVQIVSFGAPGDVPIPGDFDGDGKADFTIRRGGEWYTYKTSNGDVVGAAWGVQTDVPVPADYDGDEKDDIAIFRPSDGTWWIFRSLDNGVSGIQWGQAGDVPVPGDYDGDGKYDTAIYRGGTWWVYFAAGGHVTLSFGAQTDIPIAKKYIP